MLLNAIVEKLKHHSKNDFKGRQFEACLILQAVKNPAERPGFCLGGAVL